MISDEQMKDEMAGTTAVVVILKNQKIYCVRISLVFLINGSHSSDQATHFLHQSGSESSGVNLWYFLTWGKVYLHLFDSEKFNLN